MNMPIPISPGTKIVVSGKIYRVDKAVGRDPVLTRIHRVVKI